jgi:hypothetical protein
LASGESMTRMRSGLQIRTVSFYEIYNRDVSNRQTKGPSAQLLENALRHFVVIFQRINELKEPVSEYLSTDGN